MRRIRKVEKLRNRSERASLADDGKFDERGIWMKCGVDSLDSVDASDCVDSPVYDVL